MEQCVLAIDFGTTYTTVAIRRGAGHPELLEIDGDRRVPSVVLAEEESGQLLVGRRAVELAAAQPRQAVREAKRRIGEPAPILLGGRPYPVATVVGAVLRFVSEQAVAYSGCPVTQVVLTHPATWRRTRTDALRSAAGEGGIDEPVFLLEPVAAALAYEDSEESDQGPIAVYDLGGGTFDTAVLARSDDGFVLVGEAGGDGRIGGELFDEILAHQLGEFLAADVWDALQSSDEVDWRWAWATYRSEVRRAKEALSLNDRAEFVVGHPSGLSRLALSRAEFEGAVEATLRDTVDILDGTIADAGLATNELRGIYLVGGGSRIPLVEQLLQEAFPGVPLLRQGDPKMAVALGATYVDGKVAETPRRSGLRSSKGAVPPPVVEPGPAPATLPPAPSGSRAPGDMEAPPAGPPPLSPDPSSAETVPDRPVQPPPPPLPPAPRPEPAGGAGRPPGGRLTTVWIVAAAAAVLVLSGVAVAALLLRGGNDGSPAAVVTLPPSSTAPSTSARPDPGRMVVASMEDLLVANNGARKIVAESVAGVQGCSTDPTQAANLVVSAIATRSQLLTRLLALDTAGLAEGADLKSSLKQAWSASIDADKQFVGWMRFVATDRCVGAAPQNTDFASATSFSKQATSSKQQFADLWNRVATRYGVAPVAEGDL